jgi:hypothetical protein
VTDHVTLSEPAPAPFLPGLGLCNRGHEDQADNYR